MIHKIKLIEDFIEPVLLGSKNFEIRLNDRGYQKGDFVGFIPVDKNGIEIYTDESNRIKAKYYIITYVLSGWGLQDGYVAFGIERTDINND